MRWSTAKGMRRYLLLVGYLDARNAKNGAWDKLTILAGGMKLGSGNGGCCVASIWWRNVHNVSFRRENGEDVRCFIFVD